MSTNIAPGIARTERGLVVAGTRTTLYAILDYLHDDWPLRLVRDWLDLTEEQIEDVLDYISAHRDEVEAEYQQVVRQDDENRSYWDERNRERFAHVAAAPQPSEKAALYAKLKAQRAALERQSGHSVDNSVDRRSPPQVTPF